MDVRRAREGDRRRLAELAARLQARPDRHVGYLAAEPDAIAAEMIAEDEDWTAVSSVAERHGEVVGWLMGSVDAEIGRVWWFGPFVDVDDRSWATVAAALYEHARRLLPRGVDEEECGPDERFGLLVDWALANGFHRDPGSAVLTLDDELAPPTVDVRPATASDVDTIGRLHDVLFAGTHTTGRRLIEDADEDHVRLVVELDGIPAGYVAVERQADGSGYIDYLGVDPAHRRRGLGSQLVAAGVAALRAMGCVSCHLTVGEDNPAARTLYAGLGFEEERVVIPLRLGFRRL